MHQTCKHAVHVLKAPHERNHEFFIICCSYLDLWRQRRKMRDVYRCCSTLELNRMPILSSNVHPICKYALFVVTTLRLYQFSLFVCLFIPIFFFFFLAATGSASAAVFVLKERIVDFFFLNFSCRVLKTLLFY